VRQCRTHQSRRKKPAPADRATPTPEKAVERMVTCVLPTWSRPSGDVIVTSKGKVPGERTCTGTTSGCVLAGELEVVGVAPSAALWSERQLLAGERHPDRQRHVAVAHEREWDRALAVGQADGSVDHVHPAEAGVDAGAHRRQVRPPLRQLESGRLGQEGEVAEVPEVRRVHQHRGEAGEPVAGRLDLGPHAPEGAAGGGHGADQGTALLHLRVDVPEVALERDGLEDR
jgi:hypothetical protein